MFPSSKYHPMTQRIPFHRMLRTFLPIIAVFCAAVLFGSCSSTAQLHDSQALRQEVTEVEIAFAKTMADRDFDAFASFVSDEAVFLNDGKPLRGKKAVLDYWKKFFSTDKAPFSWKPELVEVLASGTLAESVGPVFNAGGKLVARYYSTWRQEEPGRWRIVFDNGYDVCETGIR